MEESFFSDASTEASLNDIDMDDFTHQPTIPALQGQYELLLEQYKNSLIERLLKFIAPSKKAEMKNILSTNFVLMYDLAELKETFDFTISTLRNLSGFLPPDNVISKILEYQIYKSLAPELLSRMPRNPAIVYKQELNARRQLTEEERYMQQQSKVNKAIGRNIYQVNTLQQQEPQQNTQYSQVHSENRNLYSSYGNTRSVLPKRPEGYNTSTRQQETIKYPQGYDANWNFVFNKKTDYSGNRYYTMLKETKPKQTGTKPPEKIPTQYNPYNHIGFRSQIRNKPNTQLPCKRK